MARFLDFFLLFILITISLGSPFIVLEFVSSRF